MSPSFNAVITPPSRAEVLLGVVHRVRNVVRIMPRGQSRFKMFDASSLQCRPLETLALLKGGGQSRKLGHTDNKVRRASGELQERLPIFVDACQNSIQVGLAEDEASARNQSESDVPPTPASITY